jgi:hypothetical protein
MSIHTNLDQIKLVAKNYAEKHNVRYNVILLNPVDGNFGDGSTYEFVTDSYFEDPTVNHRNYLQICNTDQY